MDCEISSSHRWLSMYDTCDSEETPSIVVESEFASSMAAIDFFEVAPPIDRENFLSITHEVLQSSLLVLAPFGLPSQLRKAVGSETLFLRKYGPLFRFILEAISEKVYEARGVSESEVAVSLHKYTEQEQDPEAIAYMGRMRDALRLVYSPPRFLELPAMLPVANLANIGLSMLRSGAIYVRQTPVSSADLGGGSCSSSAAEGSAPAHAAGISEDECSGPQCLLCQARRASAGYDERSLGAAAVEAHPSSLDHEKAQRAKVASCLQAMNTLRRETEEFSGTIEQAHFQAMSESYAARYSGGSMKTADFCMCSARSDIPSEQQGLCAAMAALDEIVALPFKDNKLFMLLTKLEERLGQEKGTEKPSDAAVQATDNTYEDPEVALEAVLTSQAYRIRADQHMENGRTQEAATCFDEAHSEGDGYLPDRCLAELLAGRAQCHLLEHDFEAAQEQAEAALALHSTCGEAFLVRGKCRLELKDNEGALSDLVNAFVLQGSALNAATDAGEVQAIEDASREASRARATEAFSLRKGASILPADWMVRSFLASYNREELYAERERFDSLRPPDAPEPPAEEMAFWEGIDLVKEGRFAESMASFSTALEAEDSRVRSLALEHYGSFLYLMRDMDASLESFRSAAESDPSNVKSWVKKGSILSDLGRQQEAFECFSEAEAIDPLDADLYLHRGQGHLLASNFREATADLQKSVELCPTMPISRAAWGVALFKLGTVDGQLSPSKVTKCLQVMEDALERFPNSSEVLLFFAEVLIGIGDFARGLELLKLAASLDGECPLPFVNAARAYLGMNDLVAARRHLERGQELDPSYPGTFMDMGQLLMQEGSPADALAMYARGVETARFPSEIHDAMASLDVAKCHLNAQQLLHRCPAF